MVSLFSGHYLTEFMPVLPLDDPTLAECFQAAGYDTLAVVSNMLVDASGGFARGFDHYDDSLPQREIVRGWPERTAATTTDAAIASRRRFLPLCVKPVRAIAFYRNDISGQDPARMRCHPHDKHPSGAANRIAARQLASALLPSLREAR